MNTCLPPKETITAPGFVPPAGTCDSHCHIFGPADRFPYAADRPYTPPDAPKERLRRLHELLGIDRTVLVQPACHGTDHRAILDAIGANPERRRGVAILDATVSDAELERLHAGGMRGVRFNFVGHLGAAPEPRALSAIAARIAPLGWHVAVHIAAEDVARLDAVFALPLPVVIDHMARVRVADGIGQAPFRRLLAVLGRENCWVKLSAADRISAGVPGYRDAVPFAQALIEAAPDRVLWGTDWPHPNVGEAPDDGVLMDLVPEIAPDPDQRYRLLVDNPARLFGFPLTEDER